MNEETHAALDAWYRGDNGRYLRSVLQCELDAILETAFGYHALQVGFSGDGNMLGRSPINHCMIAAPNAADGVGLVCESDEIPLESDSVDVLVAHHAVEFSRYPHQVLREMGRVLAPQGQLLLTGFNPYSLTGIANALHRRFGKAPWNECAPVNAPRMIDWLHLVGCELQRTHHLHAVPGIGRGRLLASMRRADRAIRRYNWPCGGVYLVHAMKQVSAGNRPAELRRRPRRLITLVPGGAAQPSPSQVVPAPPHRNSAA